MLIEYRALLMKHRAFSTGESVSVLVGLAFTLIQTNDTNTLH